MSNVTNFPRVKRQLRNEAHIQHKIKPTFLQSREKEFHPQRSCKVCNPTTNGDVFEELGVRDLFKVIQLKKSPPWHKTLRNIFESIQVHWGQFEKLQETDDVCRVYVINHQNQWDAPIIAYILWAKLQLSVQFMNQYHFNNTRITSFNFNSQPKGGKSKVLFINLEDAAETCLGSLVGKLCDTDVLLIPTSICYEFTTGISSEDTSSHNPEQIEWKPNVRVNFGIPHSLKDFMEVKGNCNSMVAHVKKHLIHDIWRNTPIMSIQVLSALLQNLSSLDDEFSACKLMNEFQKMHRPQWDLAFIGEIDDIMQYSLKILALKGVASSSVAVDVMKHESIMMKSLFAAMDFIGIDLHSSTFKLDQNRLLENYRTIVKILRYEIDFINPPCLDASAIEKKALDSLLYNCVVSEQSDEATSDEQQKAKKIAYNLDLELEDEYDYLCLPEKQIFLYVDLAHALSRKWVASIATRLLDVYYVAVRKLLDLRRIDVIEETEFVRSISAAFNEKCSSDISAQDVDFVVRNALKLFIDEGIIESYIYSDIKILYLKDPFDEENILRLIHEIAQFC